jgi:hypothetical protein
MNIPNPDETTFNAQLTINNNMKTIHRCLTTILWHEQSINPSFG